MFLGVQELMCIELGRAAVGVHGHDATFDVLRSDDAELHSRIGKVTGNIVPLRSILGSHTWRALVRKPTRVNEDAGPDTKQLEELLAALVWHGVRGNGATHLTSLSFKAK